MGKSRSSILRFANFELDAEREELRKRGALIKLQTQPFKVLALLATRPGETVSREEIQRCVWGEETFVDYDQGINTCIRQVRLALGDRAASPRFVETVPRRGYRFLAPVEAPAVVEGLAAGDREAPRRRPAAPRRRAWAVAGGAVLLAAAALVVGALVVRRGASPSPAALLGRATPGSLAERLDPAAPGLLVVLPFHDFSPGPAESYLADGMTEELITELARRYGGRLGVVARTSAMKYKDTDKGIGEIAAELGAGYLVEGSVRRVGERIRVTAQLVRAADQAHLWAGNYDRDLADVLKLQAEVSEKIGQALALALQIVPGNDPPQVAATRPEAYRAYREGLHHLNRRWDPGVRPREASQAAHGHLQRAIALDPGFAPAYVELATAYRMLLPSYEGARKAREALHKALALDDSLAQAHLRLARLRFYHDLDLEGARRAFERSIELSPGLAAAHHDFAAYYSVIGRHDAAVASVERALRLDPLSPSVSSDVGWYFYFGRRYEEAMEHSRRTLELEPGYIWAEECILLAAMAHGTPEVAVAQARDDMQEAGASEADLRALAVGDPEAALLAYWQWRLARRLAWHRDAAGQLHVAPTELATSYMALGEPEKALAELERAYEERAGWILPFLPVHPLFDALRSDPRFTALLDRISGREGRSAG